ncbi:TonB-dependent receptor [Sphingomonas sp. So64.6b]|uniref:TonB-dependent receptor n=1 Tax=Sphingomonas sp. So64.6b TaxID=2997354 RepID=UPI001601D8F9|nr:TonB-dependent receptor [Sphingomonas sp. So64.6b]QNA83230.1 TonB-dependent receptor [Sphingomonas sp. So64.6b]
MSKVIFARKSLFLGAAVGALLCAGVASAQDAPVAAAPEAASGDGLQDIVVTAERRSENLQKVPLSVAVVGGEELRNFQTGGEDILSLAGRVPGLYAETTTGRIFPRFYIRGLGNIDFYLGASQPVSIIQDDVVLEHVVLKSNPVFDVNQVEVLRGPQGSLFGRNTTAGIIKFDTIRPSNEFSARASASYGSYNTVTFDGGIGGPIAGDVLSLRISALYQHRDDWVDNTYVAPATFPSTDGTVSPKKNAMGGFNEKDIRVQLLYTPDSDFSLLLSAHKRDYDGTSTIFHRGALKKGSNDISAEPRDRIALDEAQNNPQAYKTSGGQLKMNYDFGPVALTSITAVEGALGYSRGDTDGGAGVNFPFSVAPAVPAPNGFGQSQGNLRGLTQFTQELRLASDGDGPFKWQIGGMYFDQRDVTEFYQRTYFLLPNQPTYNPNNFVRLHDVNTSWAIFGQASYQVTPALTITAGGRITEDKKQTRLVRSVLNATGKTDMFPVTAPRFVELKDTQPSWDISALYEVSPDFSIYARVARGFRGPTIQGRSAVFNSAFTTAQSETIVSWEGGFKSKLFNDTLRFNASAFYYTVNDIQLNGNDSNGNGVLFNADKAKAYGMEADLDLRPIRNLTLTAGLSLLHSEIKDKRVFAQACSLNGVLVCTVQDPIVSRNPADGKTTPGITYYGPNTTYFAQIDGNPLPNAPKYTVDFTGRYDLPISDSGKVFIATDWNLQGYTNLVLYKTKEFYANGNFEGGVKVGYTGGNGDWEIALFGRNITNEKNLKGVIENYMAAVFNEPRVVGISFSGKLH